MNRGARWVVLLALASAVTAATARAQLVEPGVPRALTLAPGERVDVPLQLAHAGTLGLWLEGDDRGLSLSLVLDGRERATAGPDRDHRWLSWLVEAPGAEAVARIRAADQAARVVLHLVLSHDDARTRAAAEALGRALHEVGRARAAGEDERARSLLAAGLDAWQASGRAPSAPAAEACAGALDAAVRGADGPALYARILEEQLAVALARQPADTRQVLRLRRQLGEALVDAGDFGRAASAYGLVHTATRQRFGDDPELVGLCVQYDMLLRRLERHAAALDVQQFALGLIERLELPAQREARELTAGRIESLGVLGRFAEARPLALEHVEATREALAGLGGAPASEVVAGFRDHVGALTQAGDVARRSWRLDEAEEWHRAALDLARNLSRQFAGDAGLAADAAIVAMRLSRTLLNATSTRVHEARALAEQASAELADLGPDQRLNRELARALEAECAVVLGDLTGAATLMHQALPVLEELYGPEHHAVLEKRWLLAATLWDDQRFAESATLFDEVIERCQPRDDPLRALAWQARAYRAYVDTDLGHLEDARQQLAALDGLDGGPLLPERSRLCARHEQARVLLKLGEVTQAAALHRELEERLAERAPLDADMVWRAQGLGAEIALAAGDVDRARRLARAVIEHLRDEVLRRAATNAPRELESLLGAYPTEMGQLVRLALALPELADPVVALCEGMRGLGLASRERMRAGGEDPQLAELRRAWRVAVDGLSRADSEERRLVAVRERDQLQRELVERLAARQPLSIEAPEIPVGRLAAGFLAVPDGDGGQRLVATLRRADAPAELIDLGDLIAVREAVACWREALGVPSAAGSGCEPSIRATGRALAARVLEPLRPHLRRGEAVTWLPDDVLHLVPLGALPWDDGLLGDAHPGHRGWGARLAAGPSSSPAVLPGQRLTLLGDLRYGPRSAADGRARGAPGAPFAELPGSRAELERLAELQTTRGAGAPRLLTGDSVDRQSLAAAVDGADLLHVSTHAWARPVPGFTTRRVPDRQARPRDLSPLLHTGLALSGANGSLDGLVNGEQLAALDLSACRLAVLAGCATNAGEPATWQGVASLAKAVHMAGAECVVSSLWPVDDVWTGRLMEAFYDGLWNAGLGPEEALWQAQQRLRSERALPRHWAGWVVSRLRSAGPG